LVVISIYTIQYFGTRHAAKYERRFIGRLQSLAREELPRPRPCDVLMRGRRDAAGLAYCLERSHYIILREGADSIEVIAIIDGRRGLQRKLQRLAQEN
jgi:plasmid stabilization system protein ParE